MIRVHIRCLRGASSCSFSCILRDASNSTTRWRQRHKLCTATKRRFVPVGSTASDLNAFITEPPLVPSEIATSKTGTLVGLRVAVKDNICTKDMLTTCGSRGLENYRSPYDATVVSQLRDAGASISGKTNLDEFGMGSHSVNSAFGPVRGVYTGRSAGGSSGGSAVAVARGECDVALGTDTGGSVRLPAAYCGIYGFKPSYGLISRWGVVAYANSLDTVGLLSNNISTLRKVFEELNKFDSKDPTSLPKSSRMRLRESARRTPTSSLCFGVPSQYNTDEVSPALRQAWSKTIRFLQKQGHTVKTVSLPTTQHSLSAYYILAPAEASSNLAKYDGARYGTAASLDEPSSGALYAASRAQGFGEEVRRRILLGSYSLSADAIDNYFIKAQKVRRLVRQDFNEIFALPNVLARETDVASDADDRIDALICPTAPDFAPMIEKVQSQSSLDVYAGDVFTVPASLAGLPAINVPVKTGDASHQSLESPNTVGIQIITQYGDDHTALEIGSILEPLRE